MSMMLVVTLPHPIYANLCRSEAVLLCLADSSNYTPGYAVEHLFYTEGLPIAIYFGVCNVMVIATSF